VTARIAAGLGAALLAITALLVLLGGDPASPLRHAYLAPVVLGALRGGAFGGALTAAAALLLYAPFVLPELERSGLTPETAEGLATLGVVAGTGTLVGALTTRAVRLRERYETLVATQRVFAEEAPLEEALERLCAVLARRLRMTAVALAVRDGERLVVTGGGAVAPGSVAATVMTTAEPAFVSDAGGGRRPRRVFVTPLLAGGRPLGALAL